ncbi:MAG: hypothetical protein IANPNBLG_01776 [Bryobacteraceae bacterium]|nr:hypothetical protein [Bryobacteraceae bacterium]MCC6343117.1 hypothetical protein [Bryobacterales bacterium]
MEQTDYPLLPNILIPGESAAFLQSVFEGARSWLQPRNPFERLLIDMLAATLWRHARLATLEARILTIEQDIQPGFLLKQFKNLDPAGRAALVFNVWHRKFTALSRVEAAVLRNFHTLLKTLAEMRKAFPHPPSGGVPV